MTKTSKAAKAAGKARAESDGVSKSPRSDKSGRGKSAEAAGKVVAPRRAGASEAAETTLRTRSRKSEAAKIQDEQERREAIELKAALARASGAPKGRKASDYPQRTLSAREREAMRGLVIYLDDEARRQLAKLAIDQGRTTQDLGVEAVNLLFQFHGVRRIA